jgi:hypothetical protein
MPRGAPVTRATFPLSLISFAPILDYGFHHLGISDGNGSELRFRASRINPNRRILGQAHEPLRVGAAQGQQREPFAFQHEPDRNRDCFPGLPADDADLNR